MNVYNLPLKTEKQCYFNGLCWIKIDLALTCYTYKTQMLIFVYIVTRFIISVMYLFAICFMYPYLSCHSCVMRKTCICGKKCRSAAL